MADKTAYNVHFAARVAQRFVEADTMTDLEAKKVLGLPASARPSPEEVEKLRKTLTLKYHPDRPGGDAEMMKQVNRACDVLSRKAAPPLERTPRPEPAAPKKPPVVDTVKGESFANATASVPNNVEWKFISKPMYAQNKDKRAHYSDVWTVVGVTDAKWVVIGLQWRHQNQYLDTDKGGTVIVEEGWYCNMVMANRGMAASKILPKLIKSASVLFEDGTITDPPKRFVAWEGGPLLNEAGVKKVKSGSGGATLKDILIGTRLVSDEAPEMAGRKSVVEMWTKYSTERRKRMQVKYGPKLYSFHAYDFFVRVNGHEFKLEDDTIDNLDRNGFLLGVFGNDCSEKAPKQLNRLRGGFFKAGPGDAIRLLTEALTGEPSALILALTKAAEEWDDPTARAASVVERFTASQK